ncbi:MAG: TRAP transporter TatT component family protein, partial [Desulfotignum sp.]|nr:TRAP transporter TatT component family protein [Desulfotignum sp.]
MKSFAATASGNFLLIRLAAVLTAVFIVSGCSVSSKMMGHLSDTIVNNDDPAMVEAGAPAYLLMIDSLISQDPEDKDMLTTAALLYTAYADLFVTDKV